MMQEKDINNGGASVFVLLFLIIFSWFI